MAIDKYYLSLLANLVDSAFKSKMGAPGPKAACLSYPDLVVDHASLIACLGADRVATLTPVANDREVRAWHGLSDGFGPIYEADSLIRSWGFDVTYFDLYQTRGFETVIDLNHRLPEQYVGRFDLVIDTGTLEHCFNVGMAFRSMCDLVKPGGFVIAMAPATMMNHGFWNFSPTAFHDGFTQNGFTVHGLQSRSKGAAGATFFDFMPSPTRRATLPPESVLMCVARKTNVQPFVWPTQSKYLALAARRAGQP